MHSRLDNNKNNVEQCHYHIGCKIHDSRCQELLPWHPLDQFEYMHMAIKLIPEEIIQQYDLRNKYKNGFVYMQIKKHARLTSSRYTGQQIIA